MSFFIDTIKKLTTYVATYSDDRGLDLAANQLKELLSKYSIIAEKDINAIDSVEELDQMKAILDILKTSLNLDVPNAYYVAIDNRIQAITTIRQLGRNCQELLETEHELSRRAGILADLLTKYQEPLTLIANNVNFIPKAIAAYRTLQKTDSEFPSLDQVDLQSLKGIGNFAEKLRFDIGRSENFGKRIAAIFDITLSYAKIEYVIRTFLEDKKVVATMKRTDFQPLDNWPIAPMQRLPRLMLFPSELKKLLGKLSANPTVTGQQISDINERIEYFFKEKIYKHSHRLNQAKKAMDERVKLKRVNSSYLANLAALFTGQVIQWETDEAPEIKAVIDSVPSLMLASTLGTAPNNIDHTSGAQPSASPAAASSKSDEPTIPSENFDFDKYLEQLDQIGEPLLNHPQSPATSPLMRSSSTILQNDELASFKKMISAVQKRQQEPSAETTAAAQSAIEQKRLVTQAAEARQKTEADERAKREREAKAEQERRKSEEQERLAREEKRRQEAVDKQKAEEAKQKADAEQRQRQAREEAERRRLEEQERRERERQAAEAQKKAAEERARKEREEAERRAAERREQIEREHQEQLEQARRAQAEREERDKKTREEAAQRAALARAQHEREAAQREQAERERQAREEEQAKKARDDAERLERERQAREAQQAAEIEAKRLADAQQEQVRQEAAARARQSAASQQQPATASTKLSIQDIEAAKQLVDNYLDRLKKPYANPQEFVDKASADVIAKNSQATTLSSHLDDLLKNASEQDKAILNGAIYNLIKTLLTDDPSQETTKQQQNKLRAIANFERDYCHLTYTGGEKVLATLKTIVVIAVGLVLGAAIAATAAVIIAAAATGVVPPLTVAGISASLTTAWSIYAGSGGAILGTIIGTTAGIKRFFFPENLPKELAASARSYLAAADSPKLSA